MRHSSLCVVLQLLTSLMWGCTPDLTDEAPDEDFRRVEARLGQVVRAQVSASADDAEENAHKHVTLTSSDLEFVTDGAQIQLVGQRFSGLRVPANATIQQARVEYTVDEVSSGSSYLTIRAELGDSAAPFSTQPGNVSSRRLTDTFVTWAVPPWSDVGEKQRSPDLSTLIQAVVDQPEWESGNALALVVTGSGTRVAKAFDGSNSDAPALVVEFDADGPSGGRSADRDSACSRNDTGSSCSPDCGSCGTCAGSDCPGPTAPNLLVAFIGDQGNNGNSDAVLELIKAERADAVVHNGDFDYQDDPSAWDSRITRVLGATYPYFSVIGNHDAAAWGGASGYAAKIEERHARNDEMQCTGELGVKANCTFRGLHLVTSCIGTKELRPSCDANSPEHIAFIRDSLQASRATFKVCNWHKNQHHMQVGGKGDQVGWDAYQECMHAGAIVATGHEHSYSRTLTLTDVGNSVAGHGAVGPFDQVRLSAGETFVFVSGLAGVGLRPFDTNHTGNPWWASYYTSTRWLMNGELQTGTSNYGALFVAFHIDGDARRARGYFKDVDGRIADTFEIQVR